MTAVLFKRAGWYALAALALCFLVLQPLRAQASQWNIDQLMQMLAKVQQGRASFVEKKYIAVLKKPVESSGELLYTAPDRLEKKTVKPKPETMVLVGDMLTIERGRQKHTLQLQDYPELLGLVDSIRGTLSGNRKALERFFKLSLAGDAQRWTLSLAPHDERVAQTVHQIRISGTQDNVRTVDILHPDGDRSVMTIERLAAQ